MKYLKKTTTGLSAMILGMAFLSSATFAQSAKYQRKKPEKVETPAAPNTAAKEADPQKKKTDKIDISDLEQKYWAPKDTDYSVVQNRTYTKDKKFGISLLAGPVINDGFSEGFDTSLTVNYFFSEREGVELSYISSNLKNNEVTTAFQRDVASASGLIPDHGKITQYIGIGYNFVPIYAKVSFLGNKILYFDMAITPTIGMTSYDQQVKESAGGNKGKSALSVGFDFTQYLFIGTHWAIRGDIRNRWFKEEILNYSNGTKLRDITTHASIFLVGVTYLF